MCTFFNCKIPAPEGKMCVGHNKLFGKTTAVATDKGKAVAIPKRSDKMKKTIQDLKKKYKEFLSRPENQYCKIKFPGCTKVATVVNHDLGRGENVLNEHDWTACCPNCNGKIESDHAKAAEKGHKKQRHNKANLRGKIKQIAEAKPIKQ